MLVDILNKILVIMYVLSLLNVFRHTYYFIQSWVKSKTDNPQKYRLDKRALLLLGLSLAFILSSFFYGITI